MDGGAKLVNITDKENNENFIDSSNIFITLSTTTSSPYSVAFMNMLLGYVGAKTDINYRIELTKTNTIKFPILAYQKDELHNNPILLIKKRIETLKNYIENFDWNVTTLQERYIAREHNNFELKLRVVSDNSEINDFFKEEIIQLKNFAENINPKAKKISLKNGSFVMLVADPLLQDYGLYLDLSVPFSEYNFGHNYLHLYEHLMTIGWENLDSADVIEFNGSTYPTGISFVYNIHKNIESLKKYANATINFIRKTRSKDFWENDMKKHIERETSRTISETLNLRSYSIFGRSDVKAYVNKYNIDVFHYWSNKPFRILITCRSFDEINLNESLLQINDENFKEIEFPEEIKLTKVPIEVFKMKKLMGLQNKKVKLEEMLDIIYNNKLKNNACYGLDCILETSDENSSDIGENNGVLHQLLFLARYVDENIINQYLQIYGLPNTNLVFAYSQ